ncbi:MAG: phosphatidylserine decarboxylase [Proteobacteria bacterium]|nr:phosphatidylserine decarboxylase [Pseudomonadota bacterium]
MQPYSPGQRLYVALQYLLPHHLISAVVYRATRWCWRPWKNFLIRTLASYFKIDLGEALDPDPDRYANFNEFFTRRLKPEVRPIASDPASVVCPADGAVSQVGVIENGRIFQAKGHHYTTVELLGGDQTMAAFFKHGRFATIYLAPNNYHRLHMPLDAQLKKMIHVPGRLFSVAPWTVRTIPRIFTRNERVVCLFATGAGPLAMVLVGAINVAAIETVWSGLVTPPKGKKISEHDYSHTKKLYSKGEEMGRFNMGSTVILLTAGNVEWLKKIRANQSVKMGELIGHFPKRKKPVPG